MAQFKFPIGTKVRVRSIKKSSDELGSIEGDVIPGDIGTIAAHCSRGIKPNDYYRVDFPRLSTYWFLLECDLQFSRK